VLVLLFPIGVLALVFTIYMFTLGAWLKALTYACETKFLAAGVWLCIGIFMVDVINVVGNGEEWRDFGPLYIFVMSFAVCGTVLMFWRVSRRARPHISFDISAICRDN